MLVSFRPWCFALYISSACAGLSSATAETQRVCVSQAALRTTSRNCRPNEREATLTFKDQKNSKTPPENRKHQLAIVKDEPALVGAHPLPVVDRVVSKDCGPGWNSRLLIGDSFNDINFLSTGSCNAATAKGAQFGFSRDGVTGNSQWLAKGAIAERFVWLNEFDERPRSPYVNLFAFAPVASFHRIANSNKAFSAKNVDVLNYGFSSEALVAGNPGGWQNYLRARALLNGNFAGDVHSWSATGEFQPFHDNFLGRPLPVGRLFYVTMTALLRAQYFQRVDGDRDPIFRKHDSVMRAGPVLSLTIRPAPSANANEGKEPDPPWFFNITYSWYQDFLSKQTSWHLNPSFTYNITENVGLTLAYDRGNIEQNGKKIDLATIGLSVKY